MLAQIRKQATAGNSDALYRLSPQHITFEVLECFFQALLQDQKDPRAQNKIISALVFFTDLGNRSPTFTDSRFLDLHLDVLQKSPDLMSNLNVEYLGPLLQSPNREKILALLEVCAKEGNFSALRLLPPESITPALLEIFVKKARAYKQHQMLTYFIDPAKRALEFDNSHFLDFCSVITQEPSYVINSWDATPLATTFLQTPLRKKVLPVLKNSAEKGNFSALRLLPPESITLALLEIFVEKVSYTSQKEQMLHYFIEATKRAPSFGDSAYLDFYSAVTKASKIDMAIWDVTYLKFFLQTPLREKILMILKDFVEKGNFSALLLLPPEAITVTLLKTFATTNTSSFTRKKILVIFADSTQRAAEFDDPQFLAFCVFVAQTVKTSMPFSPYAESLQIQEKILTWLKQLAQQGDFEALKLLPSQDITVELLNFFATQTKNQSVVQELLNTFALSTTRASSFDNTQFLDFCLSVAEKWGLLIRYCSVPCFTSSLQNDIEPKVITFLKKCAAQGNDGALKLIPASAITFEFLSSLYENHHTNLRENILDHFANPINRAPSFDDNQFIELCWDVFKQESCNYTRVDYLEPFLQSNSAQVRAKTFSLLKFLAKQGYTSAQALYLSFCCFSFSSITEKITKTIALFSLEAENRLIETLALSYGVSLPIPSIYQTEFFAAEDNRIKPVRFFKRIIEIYFHPKNLRLDIKNLIALLKYAEEQFKQRGNFTSISNFPSILEFVCQIDKKLAENLIEEGFFKGYQLLGNHEDTSHAFFKPLTTNETQKLTKIISKSFRKFPYHPLKKPSESLQILNQNTSVFTIQTIISSWAKQQQALLYWLHATNTLNIVDKGSIVRFNAIPDIFHNRVESPLSGAEDITSGDTRFIYFYQDSKPDAYRAYYPRPTLIAFDTQKLPIHYRLNSIIDIDASLLFPSNIELYPGVKLILQESNLKIDDTHNKLATTIQISLPMLRVEKSTNSLEEKNTRVYFRLFYLFQQLPKKYLQDFCDYLQTLSEEEKNKKLTACYDALFKPRDQIRLPHGMPLRFDYLAMISFRDTKENLDIDRLRTALLKKDLASIAKICKDWPKAAQTYFLLNEFLRYCWENHPELFFPVMAIIKQSFDADFLSNNPVLPPPTANTVHFVAQNFYNHPFKEPTLADNLDAELSLTDPITGEVATLYRPNHGSLHAQRQIIYLPSVLLYFLQYANDNSLKETCRMILQKPEVYFLLEMALLFMVTGRESEATRSKHPNECAQYREDSVGYFRVYATRFKKYLPHFDILLAALSAAIKNLCHDAFLADPSASPEAKNFCIVLSFIHELDLPRCEASVFEKIMKKRKALVIIGNEQGEALEKLIDYAKACIMTSGDRLIGERDYDSERFFRLSQDTVLGYQILNAVPKPELASPSASKSEESEESESELENPLFASPQMH